MRPLWDNSPHFEGFRIGYAQVDGLACKEVDDFKYQLHIYYNERIDELNLMARDLQDACAIGLHALARLGLSSEFVDVQESIDNLNIISKKYQCKDVLL